MKEAEQEYLEMWNKTNRREVDKTRKVRWEPKSKYTSFGDVVNSYTIWIPDATVNTIDQFGLPNFVNWDSTTTPNYDYINNVKK